MGVKITHPNKNVMERVRIITEWLDSRPHQEFQGKGLADVQQALLKIIQKETGYVPSGYLINSTVTWMEEHGLVTVERSGRSRIMYLKLLPQHPVSALETLRDGVIEINASGPTVDLEPIMVMMRAMARALDDNLKVQATIREREAQVAKILGDMSQANTRRYDALVGKTELLHAALSGDRNLRQNYSARLGLVERKLDAIMAKLGIKLSD